MIGLVCEHCTQSIYTDESVVRVHRRCYNDLKEERMPKATDDQLERLGELELARDLARKFFERTDVTAAEIEMILLNVVLEDDDEEEDDED